MRTPATLCVLATMIAGPCDPPPPPPPAPGIFHLAPDGSDAASGLDVQNAWRTFAHALPRLGPGAELVVHGGTYRELVRGVGLWAGRADARIRVYAAPGEDPVLVGVLELGRPYYWTFDGIDVRWDDALPPGTLPATQPLVGVTHGVGWEILNAEISGARSFAALSVYADGTTVNEPHDWRVAGNCIHDTAAPVPPDIHYHNVYVNNGLVPGSGVIEDNLIFDAPDGANVKLGWRDYWDATTPPSGTENVLVRRNTLVNGLENLLLVGNTLTTAGTRNVTIERNLLVEAGPGQRPIRGSRTNNATNVARDNVWWDDESDELIWEYPPLYALPDGTPLPPFFQVVDGGGNVRVDPALDGTSSCAEFHATNPAVPQTADVDDGVGYGHTW